MKRLKREVKKRELIKLQLVKSSAYKRIDILKGSTLEEINHRLKKSLKVLYYYHTNNKRLLFIGGSKEESEYLSNYFKRTRHAFVSQTKWINGIINNRNMQLTVSRDSRPRVLSYDVRDIIKLRNKFDLFVITDEQLNNPALIESSKLKVPIITLNSNMSPFNSRVDFKTPGNLICQNNSIKTNFFYALLKSVISKGDRFKKRCPQTTHKLKELSSIEKERYVWDRRPKWVKERSVDRKHTEKVWLSGKESCTRFFRKKISRKSSFISLSKKIKEVGQDIKSQEGSVMSNSCCENPALPIQHILNWALFNRLNYENPEKINVIQKKYDTKNRPRRLSPK